METVITALISLVGGGLLTYLLGLRKQKQSQYNDIVKHYSDLLKTTEKNHEKAIAQKDKDYIEMKIELTAKVEKLEETVNELQRLKILVEAQLNIAQVTINELRTG